MDPKNKGLIQKILATTTITHKTETLQALARNPSTSKMLAYHSTACSMTSPMQLQGLVCFANSNSDDVFAPCGPTCRIGEYQRGLARSALEFAALFAMDDEDIHHQDEKLVSKARFGTTPSIYGCSCSCDWDRLVQTASEYAR